MMEFFPMDICYWSPLTIAPCQIEEPSPKVTSPMIVLFGAIQSAYLVEFIMGMMMVMNLHQGAWGT